MSTLQCSHLPPDYRRQSLSRLASVCLAQGRLADAEPLCRRALEVAESLHGAAHLDTADCLHDLGRVCLGHDPRAQYRLRRRRVHPGVRAAVDGRGPVQDPRPRSRRRQHHRRPDRPGRRRRLPVPPGPLGASKAPGLGSGLRCPAQIGVGTRRPPGTHGSAKSDIPVIPNSRTGYWDWDHPVHGDSLQGWWPVRNIYSAFLANQSDLVEIVHALGHPADIEPLLELRDRFSIRIVEDAAESLGASWHGGRAGGRCPATSVRSSSTSPQAPP